MEQRFFDSIRTIRGAWKRWKEGRIEGAYLDEAEHIFVPDPKVKLWEKAAIYARVSSSKQKYDLERQVERLVAYANTQGLSVVKMELGIVTTICRNTVS